MAEQQGGSGTTHANCFITEFIRLVQGRQYQAALQLILEEEKHKSVIARDVIVANKAIFASEFMQFLYAPAIPKIMQMNLILLALHRESRNGRVIPLSTLAKIFYLNQHSGNNAHPVYSEQTSSANHLKSIYERTSLHDDTSYSDPCHLFALHPSEVKQTDELFASL